MAAKEEAKTVFIGEAPESDSDEENMAEAKTLGNIPAATDQQRLAQQQQQQQLQQLLQQQQLQQQQLQQQQIHQQEKGQQQQQQLVTVRGEASESEEEVSSVSSENPDTSTQSPVEIDSSASGGSSRRSSKARSPRHNSLLHRKLREVNGRLVDHVTGLGGKEFETANKNLQALGVQLGRSKHIMQETSNTMRLITNDLFQLEDRINVVASSSFLPDIKC